MGRIVIVCYKPKAGKTAALKELLRSHVARLRDLGLATERESICMEASDGTLLEVFEWQSADAIHGAHSNEEVQRMWAQFAEVCDYIPVGSVSEAASLFSEFAAVDSA